MPRRKPKPKLMIFSFYPTQTTTKVGKTMTLCNIFIINFWILPEGIGVYHQNDIRTFKL